MSDDREPVSHGAPPPSSGDGASPDPANAPARPPRPWLSLLFLLPLLVLLAVSILPIKRSATAMAFPYQLDNEEAFILDQAMNLAQGRTIYSPITEYPFTVGNYPPVYPLLYSGLLALFPPSLALGRGIVMMSVLLIAALLANMVAARTGRIVPSLLAVVLFLPTWALNEWIAFARVDLPAIAIGLCGLAAITSRMRAYGMILGCVFFTLAFFTKQTQVILPAAVFLAYLWRRDFIRAGLFALLMSSLVLAGVTLLNVLTSGQFLHHTILYNINEMDLGSLRVWINHLRMFESFKLLALVPALVVVAMAAGMPLSRRPGTAASEPDALLLPVAVLFAILSFLSLYSIAKVGSAANYLLEFYAAAALLIALAVGETLNRVDRQQGRRRLWGQAVAVLLLVLLSLHAHRTHANRIYFNPPPSTQLADLLGFVDLEARETTGDILSEWPIFTIRAGQEVLFQPFIMSQLARENRWDETPFVADLRESRFALLILTQDVRNEEQYFASSTPAMREAIRENYRLYREIGGYWLFVPVRSNREMPLPDVVDTRLPLHEEPDAGTDPMAMVSPRTGGAVPAGTRGGDPSRPLA